MADSRLRRFLHLERARPAGDDPGPQAVPEVADRFEGMERPRRATQPPTPARTGAQLERFGPEPEPTLELADTSARRPVNRCLRCGMENSLFATRCTGCTASLDTAEQHAYNERLWAERQAEDARAAERGAQRRAAQDAARAEEVQARREAAEAMAREIGQRERRRLDEARWGWRWGDDWGGPPGGYDPTPLGLRLLRLLPERWHLGALVASGVIVLGLSGWALAGGLRGPRGPAMGVAVGLVVLFVSPGGWRRRRRWW